MNTTESTGLRVEYLVMGTDESGEFTSDRCETRADVWECYQRWCSTPQYSLRVKETFKIVELRAIDITSEFRET